jgi:hypothetical protein
VARGVRHFVYRFDFLFHGKQKTKQSERVGRASVNHIYFQLHQLAFDNAGNTLWENEMNRYNELKLEVLSLFATTQEWLGPHEAATRLNFRPTRSAWTYFKRLWSFGLLERRSRGRGTLEYRITDLGRSRLRWLRSR